MKVRMLAVMAMILACASFSYADIIGNTIKDDGDGVITCAGGDCSKIVEHEFLLCLNGSHNIWDKGDIQGDIITDSPDDPKLTLDESIDNDTGSPWSDYHVEVDMNIPFTIDNVTVDAPWTSVTTAPPRWAATMLDTSIITPP